MSLGGSNDVHVTDDDSPPLDDTVDDVSDCDMNDLWDCKPTIGKSPASGTAGGHTPGAYMKFVIRTHRASRGVIEFARTGRFEVLCRSLS